MINIVKDKIMDQVKYQIISAEKLLSMNLHIPDYQRPYKWTRKNVSDLLSDIETAINEGRRSGHTDYKYRIGTVILHREIDKSGKETHNIVDGQQRLITLSLLLRELDSGFINTLLVSKPNDYLSVQNVFDNAQLIREWASVNKGALGSYKIAFKDILEAVVLEVSNVSEAFQLFDSQNTRGRELDPHDLLKAYHLREMSEYSFEKTALIKRWEDIPPEKIRGLFSLYLYPILKWSKKEKAKEFTANEIDVYKGVPWECSYTYAQRVRKAMPYFQIDQPFTAGSDFFKMVEHYIELLAGLKEELNSRFKELKAILEGYMKHSKDNEEQYYSTGFRYAVNLFYCVFLFYYDRFHVLDEMSVKKLFVWAMMIRVDMEALGFDTINNYAIGYGENVGYTNKIPMFFKIATARNIDDIANLRIEVVREPDEAKAAGTWNGLYLKLKNLMGVTA